MSTVERRRYKRYKVSGKAEFSSDSATASGELLDVGYGGILLRSEVELSQGTELMIHFTVEGYPEKFQARGRIVRSQMDVLAVVFLEEAAGLFKVIDSLEDGAQKGTGSGVNPQAIARRI